jgi:hypothetical protein
VFINFVTTWRADQVSVGTTGEAKSHQEGQFSVGQWVCARFVVSGDATNAGGVAGGTAPADRWYGGVVRETRTRTQGSQRRYEVRNNAERRGLIRPQGTV